MIVLRPVFGLACKTFLCQWGFVQLKINFVACRPPIEKLDVTRDAARHNPPKPENHVALSLPGKGSACATA